MARLDDAPRLLARRSELGYTSQARAAMRDEPEAISDGEQRRQTALAHRVWQQRRRDAWQEADATIGHALDQFESAISGDAALRHAIRGCRRSVAALGRRVAAG